MISKILVAMDGSELSLRAYEYASSLAKQYGAALIIVNVFDALEGVKGASAKIKQELREIAKQIQLEGGTAVTTEVLEGYKSQAKDYGIRDVKVVIRDGDAVVEILHIAEEEKVDTIIVGSKGLYTAKEFKLGRVPYRLVQHAKCPVTVVR
ncbi:MAG TPA: universal stress protein [Nitrososphaeraceae archaeon]